jgi:hypothetical protein
LWLLRQDDDFPAEPSLVDTQPGIFDAGGVYYLETEKVLKAFADIEGLVIETHEYPHEDGKYVERPIVPTGKILVGESVQISGGYDQ